MITSVALSLPLLLHRQQRMKRTGCGGFVSDADFATAEATFASLAPRADANITTLDGARRTTQINLYWHVIYKDDSPDGSSNDGGYLSASDIESQVDVLNEAVSLLGVQFNLQGAVYTLSSRWFSKADQGTRQNREMKAGLREGDESDYNVYSVGFGSKAVKRRGYTTYPSTVGRNLDDDGTVINFRTLPAGSYPSFDQGHSLIHEAGHWLGLYDTAQGGCSKQGDGVADTYSEKTPATGCPRNHNYMDGTNDKCTTDFTSGQGKRVRDQISRHRGLGG
ncbi:metalloprotease [Mycena crocata]|nr:metalloprotease [Mycena crocata]